MTNAQAPMTNGARPRQPSSRWEARRPEGSRPGVTRHSLPRSLGRHASIGMTVLWAPRALVIGHWSFVGHWGLVIGCALGLSHWSLPCPFPLEPATLP